MLERLLEYERNWFFAINGTHTVWLDQLMLFFSSIWAWSPLVLVVLFFVWKRRKEYILMLICTILTVVLNGITTSLMIKPFFMRFRPTSHPAFMEQVRILNGYHADGAYGFISGHSTNAFAFAIMSALIIKNKWYSIAIIAWALLMVYSRVYLGAHFISDVVPGIILGTFIGWGIYLFYKYFQRKRHMIS